MLTWCWKDVGLLRNLKFSWSVFFRFWVCLVWPKLLAWFCRPIKPHHYNHGSEPCHCASAEITQLAPAAAFSSATSFTNLFHVANIRFTFWGSWKVPTCSWPRLGGNHQLGTLSLQLNWDFLLWGVKWLRSQITDPGPGSNNRTWSRLYPQNLWVPACG